MLRIRDGDCCGALDTPDGTVGSDVILDSVCDGAPTLCTLGEFGAGEVRGVALCFPDGMPVGLSTPLRALSAAELATSLAELAFDGEVDVLCGLIVSDGAAFFTSVPALPTTAFFGVGVVLFVFCVGLSFPMKRSPSGFLYSNQSSSGRNLGLFVML